MNKSSKKIIAFVLATMMIGGIPINKGENESFSKTTTVSAETIWGGYYAWTYIKCRSGLNLRTGPGTYYNKITAIPYGTWVITTHMSSNGWAKVNYRGNTGWIYLNNAQYAEVYLD